MSILISVCEGMNLQVTEILSKYTPIMTTSKIMSQVSLKGMHVIPIRMLHGSSALASRYDTHFHSVSVECQVVQMSMDDDSSSLGYWGESELLSRVFQWH
jgi:hypothetical protein